MHQRAIRTRHAMTGLAAALALGATALTAPAHAATGPDHGNDTTQAALERMVENGAPGVGAMSHRPDGTWFGQAGAADLDTGRERTAKDRFRAASITKTFIATVLLQLEAEGKLSLDDTVEDWLPGVVQGNGNDGSKITLRQLLQHTSGLFNYTADPEMWERFTTGFPQHRYDTYKPRELVSIALQHQPDFEPGKGWSYSNTGYVLAGMVIEEATGKPYAKAVKQRVIKPLKLKETSFPGTRVTLPRPHAVAYSKLWSEDPDAKIHDVTELNPSWAGAAGEIVSTTGDLNRFFGALLRGELLPRPQQSAMFNTVPVGDEFPGEYGLGIYSLKLSCDKTVWGHGGSLHGSLSNVLGTRNGDHVLTANMNGDWLRDEQAYSDLFEAEFCGKKPGPGGSGPALNGSARQSPLS
ncbi:serine hydrolase domain-containing protein [Streptomyces gobiensis]|uniref:serine hydrolase domain-containing protein n=1 Tax=Streptomyces gobiensis TaxID=2875706 RepID=UPI001E2AA4DD|nr:serine hydrolase domain-containing protein [Streptomyces gobiensis]UGY93709.1 beta-lactamase family protein [Streptomyces gobiensis]